MSKNIFQIFTANPITSNAGTDLMYFGQSPYGVTNDAAMTYANFSAQFGAPFTPAALTRTSDTNVTLTLGGNPATALLQAVSITAGWTGQLSVDRGGTGLASITAHYLIIGNGTSVATLLAPSATSGVPLISQGSSSDPAYGTAVVGGGGTGNTTFTAYSVICAGTTATGAFQNVSGVGSSGQVLTSNGASALPTWQATASGGGLTWNDVSGTSQAAAVNNGYICSNANQTTVTIPATAAEGSVFGVQGKGAAGWTLQANTGQIIHFGNTASSSAGSLTSTNQWDSVQIVCVTANTTFAVISAVGNLTVA
jgi:hypothetical protein